MPSGTRSATSTAASTRRKTSAATPSPATTPGSRAAKTPSPVRVGRDRGDAGHVDRAPGQVLLEGRVDRREHRVGVEARVAQLVEQPGRRTSCVMPAPRRARRRSVPRAGTPPSASPSAIHQSWCPDWPASSRSGKSSRQWEPRVSSRSSAASASRVLTVSRLVASQASWSIVAGRARRRAPSSRSIAARRPVGGAQHADPRGHLLLERAADAAVDEAGRALVGRRVGPGAQLGRAAPRRCGGRTPAPRAASWRRAGWRRARRSTRPRRWRRGPGSVERPQRSVATPPEA